VKKPTYNPSQVVATVHGPNGPELIVPGPGFGPAGLVVPPPRVVSIEQDVLERLNAARDRVAASRKDEARRGWLREEAQRRWEARWEKAVRADGALYWRAMRFYGRNRFVTSCLACLQSIGELTPAQVDGLRRTVVFLERNTTEVK
jgi:hypothetical protein